MKRSDLHILRLRRQFRIVPIDDQIRESAFAAIRKTGQITLAAKLLGVGKTTLYRQLKNWARQGYVRTQSRHPFYVLPAARKAS